MIVMMIKKYCDYDVMNENKGDSKERDIQLEPEL